MRTLDNLKEAIEKFEEVRWYAQGIMEEMGDYDHAFAFHVAEKFSGKYYNTGGNCIVTYVPVNGEYYLGVTQECIVLYRFGSTGLNFDPDADHCNWDSSEYCGKNEVKHEHFSHTETKEEEPRKGFFATLFGLFFGWYDLALAVGSLVFCVYGLWHIKDHYVAMAILGLFWYYGWCIERMKNKQ